MEKLPSLQVLLGKTISHVWFSDYSVCYLELGSLREGRLRRDGSPGNPFGECTLFLGYDWAVNVSERFLLRKEIHFCEQEKLWLVDKLLGAIIESIEVGSKSCELEIGLSTGIKLKTLSDDSNNPDWDVRFNELNGYLYINNKEMRFFHESKGH